MTYENDTTERPRVLHLDRADLTPSCSCCDGFPEFIDTNNHWETARAVVSAGHERLLLWWDAVKNRSHPNTYGQTAHEFAGSVAYRLANDPDGEELDRDYWQAVKWAADKLRG